MRAQKMPPFVQRCTQYLSQHAEAARSSLVKSIQKPISSSLTLLVITLALALPTGLLVLLDNVSQLTQGLNQQSQILVFLEPTLTQDSITALIQDIQSRPDVNQLHYISPEEGLATFKAQSGFGEALDHLPSNPLPGVIEVEPHADITSPLALEQLRLGLQQLAGVASANLDLDWIKKLFGFIQLGTRATLALLFLFSTGVLLIIGNTIRLATQNQLEEIEVTKLIGGTNAFIRRPFLYTGLWYGLGGGLLAWCLISILLLLLDPPVSALSALYHSEFSLHGLGLVHGVFLLICSILLGLFGAYTAVSHELKQFDPV